MTKNIITLLLVLSGCSISHDPSFIEMKDFKIDSLTSILENERIKKRNKYRLENSVPNRDLYVFSTSFDTCSFQDIIEHTGKLFFHFSDINCSQCLGQQLEILKQVENKFGTNNLTIIGSVKSYRGIISLINIYKFKCKIYCINNYESVFESTEFIAEPFYFTINHERRISNLHFPSITDSLSTTIFIENTIKSQL